MGRLKGKVAIVTGGGAGIGIAYAERFLREGARVVIGDIADPSAAGKYLSELGEALALHLDVSDAASAQQLIDYTVKNFGTVDILVNNAALFASLKPTAFESIAESEWDRLFAVNVKGVWNCAKAVSPVMRAKKSGRIINVSSPTFHKGTPMLMHYVASKGAVIGITRVLSKELGIDGITVNAIAPGLTLSNTLLQNTDLQFQSDAVMASRSLKRNQVPDDLVGTAVFLASDDSAFMTGQTLIVDGGSALV